MQKHYLEIKKRYDDFYRELLGKGKLPMKDTGKGFWNAAISDEVFAAFRKAGLHKFRNFIDLGSGDGKIVMIASLFVPRATGVEIDPWLVQKSIQLQKELSHIPGISKARFIQKDFHEHHIGDYDVVFLNPDVPMYRGMEAKLLKELNGKLILHGHHFHPSNLKLEKDLDILGTRVSVYGKERKIL